MTVAADMLAQAQAAYKQALSGQSVRFGERMFTSHNIGELLTQVKYWERQVSIEAARADGRNHRGPIRFNL